MTRAALHRLAGTISFATALSLIFVGGCGEGNRDSAGVTEHEAGVTRRAEKGPVTLTLTATPDQLELSQHVRLVVDILAETGVTVLDADYGRALSEGDRQFEYRLVASHKEEGRPVGDGRLRWSYRYEIEFVLPGEHELPPATVTFVDTRGAGEKLTAAAEEQTLATEPLTLIVRAPEGLSLTPAEMSTITRLDPIDLPALWGRWWWLAPPIGLVVMLAVILLVRRRRRRRSEVKVQIPAHEWARRQLAALVAEDLVSRGLVQAFYYRVSGIVRGYIERRFGVSAPEMTTEEFLTAAVEDSRFKRDMTDELSRFLGACDLVKYARHKPRREESDAVLKAAEDFVEQTRERVTAAGGEGSTAPGLGERAA